MARALHPPAVDARRQVAECEGLVGQAGLVDQQGAVGGSVLGLAPQLETEGRLADALGLPAEAVEAAAVALVQGRGQAADAVAGADEAVGGGLALQPLGRQGGQTQEEGAFLHLAEDQGAAGRAVGLGEGLDHAGVLGDAAAIAFGAGEGLDVEGDLRLGVRRVGANQGGRGQQGQQAHSASGGADALICGGQGFGLTRRDGDGAFQNLGGRAVGVIVEGDAEVGAAHGRDRDGGADGEAAWAAPGADARLGATGLDRQGVVDGAVDGVAAQAADAHAAVGGHDHMAAVRQGQADEGVGAGAEDGAFAHGGSLARAGAPACCGCARCACPANGCSGPAHCPTPSPEYRSATTPGAGCGTAAGPGRIPWPSGPPTGRHGSRPRPTRGRTLRHRSRRPASSAGPPDRPESASALRPENTAGRRCRRPPPPCPAGRGWTRTPVAAADWAGSPPDSATRGHRSGRRHSRPCRSGSDRRCYRAPRAVPGVRGRRRAPADRWLVLDQPAAPRPRHVRVQAPGRGADGRAGRPAVVRARQGDRRLQGRHPARAGGDRVRLRHPACAEGRVHRGRGARHRRLFDAPAAGRRCGDHPVQLPGHGAAVDVRNRRRGGQHLHPQAVGEGSERAGAAGRAVHGGRGQPGHGPGRGAERGAWRQGRGRRDPDPPGDRRGEHERTGRDAVQRARQGHRRLQGRHPARPGSHRVRLRHPACAEGRVYARRRSGHRRLLLASGPGRGGGHHPVQLPGHDPDVDVRRRHRRRQHLHPEAVRARPVRAGASGRADDGGGRAQGRVERRPRRQDGGRRHPGPSRHPRRQLRRLVGHRPLRLSDRRPARETRPGHGRSQEPRHRHARRRSGSGHQGPVRRGLWLGGRTLHGPAGCRSGRQEDRR
uniref:PE-PGRS family protein n=1 Tax=Parastrongyloides trichosuri TaxID=131310 RepID=A0A0N4ZD66_PARTI